MKQSAGEGLIPPQVLAFLRLPASAGNNTDLLQHIEALSAMEGLVRLALQTSVDLARVEQIPWSMIALSAGCSTANAHKRWHKVRAADDDPNAPGRDPASDLGQ